VRTRPGSQDNGSIGYDRTGRVLFGIVLAIGVALRAYQWLERPPLWLDELALANGLLSGTFLGLFEGASDFAQAAPPGFLALEWLVAHGIPGSDFALRAPSFLCACAALPATWLAARELVGERHAWVAPALIAFSGELIFMGGQVKPYAADAFFAPLIIFCALRHDRKRNADSWRALALAGVIGPLFSFGAVFVTAGVVGHVFLRRDRSHTRAMFTVFAIWACIATLSVIVSERLLSPEADAMMAVYWVPWFPPFPPTSIEEATWLPRHIVVMLYDVVGLREVWLFGAVLLASAVLAWWQRPAVGVLLLTPIAALLVATLLGHFPFSERLLHWMVPIFALLYTGTVSRVMDWLRTRSRWLELAPAAVMLGTPVLSLATAPPPFIRDNIAPVIDRLSTEARAGDVLYVYWGAWHAWHRYGRAIEPTLGTVVTGGCALDYPRAFLRDVDQLRGKPRVWLLFGRNQVADEQALRLAYLDTIGIRNEELLVASPRLNTTGNVDLYRYDLSDSSRLALANSESFPIPASLVKREAGCRRFDAMMRRADGTRVVPLL